MYKKKYIKYKQKYLDLKGSSRFTLGSNPLADITNIQSTIQKTEPLRAPRIIQKTKKPRIIQPDTKIPIPLADMTNVQPTKQEPIRAPRVIQETGPIRAPRVIQPDIKIPLNEKNTIYSIGVQFNNNSYKFATGFFLKDYNILCSVLHTFFHNYEKALSNNISINIDNIKSQLKYINVYINHLNSWHPAELVYSSLENDLVFIKLNHYVSSSINGIDFAEKITRRGKIYGYNICCMKPIIKIKKCTVEPYKVKDPRNKSDNLLVATTNEYIGGEKDMQWYGFSGGPLLNKHNKCMGMLSFTIERNNGIIYFISIRAIKREFKTYLSNKSIIR